MFRELKVLDRDKLEKLLIARWSDFLDTRQLLTFVKQCCDHLTESDDNTVQNIKISRCEPQTSGFLVWIESTMNLANSPNPVNLTIEAFIDLDGEITNRESI
jgi:hypothetical protein